MTGNGPFGVDGGEAGAPGASDEVAGARPRTGRWLFAVVVLAAITALLVWRPWLGGAEPVPVPTPTPTAAATPTPTPTPAPTPTSSPSPPGSATVFGLEAAQGLFITAEQLVDTVPAAAGGVDEAVASGPPVWGLPEGVSIFPTRCTVARTVVEQAPAGGYDARRFIAPTMDWTQEVTLLGDPTAARAAFAALVTAVDECPEYAQMSGGFAAITWTAAPAIEGQGLYPSIVQRLSTATAERNSVGYRGHLLVGNAIVTWTVQAWGDGGLTGVGTADNLAATVQDRARAAARALG